MKIIVIVLILSLFLNGCQEHCDNNTIWGIQTCRRNLKNLEIGMTKDQVREAMMGEPYLREAAAEMEWWLYPTQSRSIFGGHSLPCTPIAFENGKVIGWGRNFYKDIPKEYDIRIDQRIKQE